MGGRYKMKRLTCFFKTFAPDDRVTIRSKFSTLSVIEIKEELGLLENV
jgi:hypothetical protein